jgi:hypothetical protein
MLLYTLLSNSNFLLRLVCNLVCLLTGDEIRGFTVEGVMGDAPAVGGVTIAGGADGAGGVEASGGGGGVVGAGEELIASSILILLILIDNLMLIMTETLKKTVTTMAQTR